MVVHVEGTNNGGGEARARGEGSTTDSLDPAPPPTTALSIRLNSAGLVPVVVHVEGADNGGGEARARGDESTMDPLNPAPPPTTALSIRLSYILARVKLATVKMQNSCNSILLQPSGCEWGQQSTSRRRVYYTEKRYRGMKQASEQVCAATCYCTNSLDGAPGPARQGIRPPVDPGCARRR